MDIKPFASLTSGLLARKGQAKPAMRPQGFANLGMGSQRAEDLGWNDMGHDRPAPEPKPAPVEVAVEAPVPPVVRQREELAEELAAASEPVAPKVRAHKTQAAVVADGRKAAFTLRLDAERHLKLRLATAVKHRSAQQLVTQALDELLAKMPELDDLAGRLPPRGHA